MKKGFFVFIVIICTLFAGCGETVNDPASYLNDVISSQSTITVKNGEAVFSLYGKTAVYISPDAVKGLTVKNNRASFDGLETETSFEAFYLSNMLSDAVTEFESAYKTSSEGFKVDKDGAVYNGSVYDIYIDNYTKPEKIKVSSSFGETEYEIISITVDK